MKVTTWLQAFVLSVSALIATCHNGIAAAQALSQEVSQFVAATRQQHEIPAVFAAIAFADREPLVIADGVRKSGDLTPVTDDDLVHIGSCTKAMTAVLIARLVDQGRLAWEDTIGERLPELAASIDEGWHDVTLVQLLSHRGGVPANATNWWLKHDGMICETRDQIARINLKTGPAQPIGSRYVYSNLGYMLAGQMAARVCGCSWEDAIRKEVFEPLQMDSAGFGPPGATGQIDQPWGHRRRGENSWSPSQHDNAPALGPAGRVHLSMRDWCRFVCLFCGGGPPEFLSEASREKLTTVVGDHYALGWSIAERPWAQGTTYNHSGSNTMWYCVAWVAAGTERAYLVAMNCSGEGIAKAADELVGKIIAAERRDARRR